MHVQDKVAIITGASSGGFPSAAGLLLNVYHVFCLPTLTTFTLFVQPTGFGRALALRLVGKG